ncbi:MAG: branched-chain amino acid ABC transporter permease [Firmicutes bacterium]|nr:branched-chain amino acid ABC transporter permease [Bacillota bacterium]
MGNTRELLRSPLSRFILVVAVPLILVLFIHFGMSSYYETVFVLFFVNVVLAASLNLTNGITGIFSLGQAGFMGLGAYIGSLLTLDEANKLSRIDGIPEWLAATQLPFPIAMLIAGILAAVIAGLIGFVILRSRGHYLAVITLGMIIVIKNLLDNATIFTNGPKGISGMALNTTMFSSVVIALITLFVLYRFRVSAYGRSMIALREDEDAAKSLGISASQIRLMSFVTSAFFGAVGGCMWAHLERTLAPSMFYFDETFVILEMSVLGGMATISGALPGAAILTFVPQLLASFDTGFYIGSFHVPQISGLTSMVMSILFILVIVFRSGGVTGNSEYIVESLFSKETYLGLLKRRTYTDFVNNIKQIKFPKRKRTEE